MAERGSGGAWTRPAGWLGLVAALLLLAASVPPVPEAVPERAGPTPGLVPSRCERTPDGYRCIAGPLPVAADQRVEVLSGVAAPAETGYVTAARATLVDARGEPVSHEEVHLHHAVWLNPHREDTTCSSYDAGLPDYERFFASGGERTPVVLPEGYGYHWDPGLPRTITDSSPYWVLVAMLDGVRGRADTFVELRLDFVPESDAQGMVGVTPVWLDVRNCSSHPVYDVPRGAGRDGVHRERWRFRMPTAGRFVFLGGHLHDGGLALRLDNVTTGRELFTSEPVYGRRGGHRALTGMTTLSDVAGIPVGRGEVLRLTALYDSTRPRENVMGIMLGALAPPQSDDRD